MWSQAELTMVAALGASALTGVTSLGVVAFQEWRRDRSAGRAAEDLAVISLLSSSLELAIRARTAGDAMKMRSGLGEGLDVLLRLRKPLDPMAMHDWLTQDWKSLSQSWAAVWTSADQETVRLANDLVAKCGELMAVTTQRQPVASRLQRLRRDIAGERWTEAMLADHQRALQALAVSRKQLANYARRGQGRSTVDLFAQS